MVEGSGRLLSLLALFQARRSWSGTELAERLGVTGRTLRRDVDRLRALGYEVEATSGPGGGYRLAAGTVVSPLLLSEDEAVMLTVALQSALAVEGERVLPILAKVDQLLPDRLRARVAAVHAQTVMVGRPAVQVDTRLLSRLASACRDSEAVLLRYRAATGEASERTIHPLRLAHTGNRRWYLVGWDPERAAWRTLRVDRVQAIVRTGPRVVRPDPPEDLAGYVSTSIAHAPYPCRATFELTGDHASLSARVPAWIGALSPAGPDRCTLRIGAPDWRTALAYAVMSGAPFRAIEPPELVHAERALADDLSAHPTPGIPPAR
ncbi:MAG: WYL domain-containing protein [Myxococcota bacterium]